jgi:RNA polymerase sigma factor (sigma-70 family)
LHVLDHEGASDATLALAAGRGDDDAFAVLYARYAPRISAYLHRLLDDEHLAQDLTHEVFVSALNRLRSARPPIAFGPWLYRIARNASIDVHRRSQLVHQVPLPLAEDDGAALRGHSEPEAEAELRQWLDDLRDLLGGLSKNHRTVLVLRELEGLSNAEIGRRMGLSRPAVEGLLFRARAKVRREYDDLMSGRRCARVQTSVDRAAAGERLARRELQTATRHLGACAQCRSHAWEAGVTDLLEQTDVRRRRRRILLPAPLLDLLPRLTAEHAALLVSPLSRAGAAITVVAVAGSTIATPARDAGVADARPLPVAAATATAAPTAMPARPAPVPRSPAATVTALPRPAAAVPSPSVAPAAAAAAAAPAPSPSPSPAPAAESAPPPARADPRHETPAPPPPAPASQPPAVPEPPATPRSVETAPEAEAAVAGATQQVAQAVIAPVAEVVPAIAQPSAPAPAAPVPLIGDVVEDLVVPALPSLTLPAPALPAVR